MGIVLLHVLQWILRIILFLLLLLLILSVIILLVPIRYQAKGEYLEKKPKVNGKVTWFFYLVYMSFAYESDFCMQVRVLGFKIFDTEKEKQKKKTGNQEEYVEDIAVEEKTEEIKIEDHFSKNEADIQNQEVEKEAVVENAGASSLEQLEQRQRSSSEKNFYESEFKEETKEKEKVTLREKITSIKLKIVEIIEKIKDVISKIREGKLKIEHYLELWNRRSTQITFQRAKKKLGKMITAILPRKWKLEGSLGFDNPCTTGQLMGVLGAMYPLFGNRVQIIPDFENEIIELQGNIKGHIRLGNLVYQLVSLLLNPHCFKFIKMIFDELGNSKNSKKEI